MSIGGKGHLNSHMSGSYGAQQDEMGLESWYGREGAYIQGLAYNG